MKAKFVRQVVMDSEDAQNPGKSEENGNCEGTNDAVSGEERLANMAGGPRQAEDDNVNGEKTRRTVPRQSTGDFNYSDLPRSLIATNVDDEVFTNESTKVIIKSLNYY